MPLGSDPRSPQNKVPPGGTVGMDGTLRPTCTYKLLDEAFSLMGVTDASVPMDCGAANGRCVRVVRDRKRAGRCVHRWDLCVHRWDSSSPAPPRSP